MKFTKRDGGGGGNGDEDGGEGYGHYGEGYEYNTEKVIVLPAFCWSCPCCGKQNFTIIPNVCDGRNELGEGEDGFRYVLPATDECRRCGLEFKPVQSKDD